MIIDWFFNEILLIQRFFIFRFIRVVVRLKEQVNGVDFKITTNDAFRHF